MERVIHELVQGSPLWHQFRLEHHGASEAAAMLGVSKTVTRTELLHAKHTGIAKEFSDWLQVHILDHGHHVEAQARPIVEEMIGEELYPTTMSYGKLSASCDGLTMGGDIAFEHKQYNESLAESVRRGELPEEFQPQCQQIMLVTGADKLIFVVSDGTREKFAHMEVLRDLLLWGDRIIAGWKQFDADLAAYTPPEVIPPPIAEPTMALPALTIQVDGAISLISNLDLFGAHLLAFIDGLDRAPSTDQGFADAEAAIKTLQKAQDALEAAESGALAQTASIEEMRRTVALYKDQARTTRLMLEKVVKLRKESIRLEIVQAGRAALVAHLDGLNTRLGRKYMPPIVADFAGVIKGKKSIASLQDAVDTELARVKIESNTVADRIQVNLNTLRELASDYHFLFSDTAQIVMKANDDLQTLVRLRISEHDAAERKRIEAERERIRKEEQAKAEAEARATIDRQERDAKLARDVEQRKAAEAQAEQDRIARLAREAAQRKADEQAAAERKARQDKERAAEEKQRKKREEEDAKQRELQRQQNDLLDGRELLDEFIKRFAHRKEFAPVVASIKTFLEQKETAAA